MPVAPMLDMAFQILAFFILVYHPASTERAVPLHASDAQATPLTQAPQPVIGIDIVADPSHGDAALYCLRTQEQKNTAFCDVQNLRDRLQACRPGAAVQIIAQAGIPMSDVVAAVDAAAAAGLTTITFGAPAPMSVRR
jgi:biopolymer transport protein ExbD